MPLLPSYPLDLTNSALSNRITDEIHTFNVLTDRMFVPSAGPFYTQGFDIRHPVTNAPLLPNVHYKILHLHKEASLQSGKNVCCIVYVHNASIPGCKINYQVVGGVYSDTADVIREILDNLPNLPNANQVHWGQIIGQPVQYPPAAHRHHVDSLYNMGDVVNVLEQIRTSMLAGDAGAFEAIYQYIFNMFGNAAFVTGVDLSNEISARSSADTRIHSIIQNTSKLNGYAIAAVLSKLLDQALGESYGFIGDIVYDGLNVEIAAHASLVQYANYSDTDGLSTSIPVIGVGLFERTFETTAPTNAVDEYNRYMLYARVVPRIDSPDTVYHPDTISDIDQYHSIGEIEYEFDGPYTVATVGNIVADQAARIGAGYALIRSVSTPYGAITTAEYPMVTNAVDKGRLVNHLNDLQQQVDFDTASHQSVLSAIVSNVNAPSGYANRGYGSYGVVNVAAPADCSLHFAKGTVLYSDDVMSPADSPTITAVQQAIQSFSLARPASDYGQYLIFARPLQLANGADIEYVVKGPYLTAMPAPNTTAIYGAGYEFADYPAFVAWRDGGNWKLMLGVTVHATNAVSSRSIKQHGMGNMLGDSPVKTYANLGDLALESDPRQLAYVRDINALFKWEIGSSAAEDSDPNAKVIVVAPAAAYAGTFLTSGRFISIYRDNQQALFNHGISVDVGDNALSTSVHLDTVIPQGRYYLNGTYGGAPVGFTEGILEVEVVSSTHVHQTLKWSTDATVWFRVRSGLGTWTNWKKLVDVSSMAISGRLIAVDRFTADGVWNKPASMSATGYVLVKIQAGGGGGPTCNAPGSNNSRAGSPGGGGQYLEVLIPGSQLLATENVVVGSGGAVDNNGGNSSFTANGTTVTAVGGFAGTSVQVSGPSAVAGGGEGGTGSPSLPLGALLHRRRDGGDGSTSCVYSAGCRGGDSEYGQGGESYYNYGGTIVFPATSPNFGNYGAGGGGAFVYDQVSGSYQGGAGHQGYVEVWTFSGE